MIKGIKGLGIKRFTLKIECPECKGRMIMRYDNALICTSYNKHKAGRAVFRNIGDADLVYEVDENESLVS